VQRSEEELRAGTRERQAGQVNVRKHVRTDREQMEVPTRREEVSVERVPVEGEASGAEIVDEEVRVPVSEEEVVVEKRPVAKEEVRIRKAYRLHPQRHSGRPDHHPGRSPGELRSRPDPGGHGGGHPGDRRAGGHYRLCGLRGSHTAADRGAAHRPRRSWSSSAR
jgi:uncharacterized protein (TIGR02271 family)